MSYQKARFISDRSDEEGYERARQQWVEHTWPRILRQAKATGAVILSADEVSFAMWGSLSRTWAVRGQQPQVKTRGLRQGLKLYGAISFFDGAFVYREAHVCTLTAKAFTQLNANGMPAAVIASLACLTGMSRHPRDEETTHHGRYRLKDPRKVPGNYLPEKL